MSADAAVLPVADPTSAGLWRLASRRFGRDRVGTFSLAVVLLFVLVSLGAALGLVAADWEREVGVSHAPPAFMGPDAAPEAIVAAQTAAASGETIAIEDPLREDLAEI